MFRELKERIQYALDNIFAKGSLAQFILVVIVAVLVVLFGMSAYFVGLFSDANKNIEGIGHRIDVGFWDTLWWSMKHLFDPSFFEKNYGATVPVVLISLAMSVMGMIIFGLLIGFISTGIEARLASLRKGNSVVKERGHILILGWSNKVAAILRLLAIHRDNLKVVILAPRDVGAMQDALGVEGIGDLPIKVILRSGNPSSVTELKRVGFAAAFSIIVLAYTGEQNPDGDPDIEAIKTLMLLASYTQWVGARPKMVGEITHKAKREIATIAARRNIPIVSSSQIISKVLVQCSRQSGLSTVYAKIFSFKGNEIYVMDFPDCAGKTFAAAAYTFPNAVLIGISRAATGAGGVAFRPVVSPGHDYVIGENEWLILLAEEKNISHDIRILPQPVRVMPPVKQPRPPLERIVIVGWNSLIYDVLHEFDEYLPQGTVIDVVSNFTSVEASARLTEFGGPEFGNISVEYRRANSVIRAALEGLDPASYDCVLFLADESHGEPDPDGRTIMSLVLLNDILETQKAARRPRVVSEILDPRNRDLVMRAQVDDIVISPEIVSMLLTQVSQQQMLIAVYDELLSAGGVEIYLKPIAHYAALGELVTFADLVRGAQQYDEVAVGVSIDGGDSADLGNGIHLNPPKHHSWTFAPGDRLVVIAQDLYE